MPANVYECMFVLDTNKVGGDVHAVAQQLHTILEKHKVEVITVDYDEPMEEALCMATGLDATRVKGCLAYVRYLRRQAESFKLPLIFGARRSESLCDALADGFKKSEAIDMEIRRGISDADWRKVSDGAPSF